MEQEWNEFENYEIAVFTITILAIISLCMAEILKYQSKKKSTRSAEISFKGYQIDFPETWNCKFEKSRGKQQSPINIQKVCSVVVRRAGNDLVFNQQYFNVPKAITILNDGYGVLVGTCFDDEFPVVTGGPLKEKYRFNLGQFKWGPTDIEGSEHTIDSKRYAMELQLMHLKGDTCYENLEVAVENKAVLFISYFFQITPMDNPYLSPIVESLHKIRNPENSLRIEPFPLCWVCHPFKRRFYYYQGSLTYPPCLETVDWIIQPEPLSISSSQLKRFRELEALDGPMRRNTRPVQKINNRKIYFYQ